MLKSLTIKTRLACLLAFLVLQLVVGAGTGLFFLKKANNTLDAIYTNRLVAVGLLDRVIRLVNRNQTDIAQAITAPADQVPAYLADIQANSKKMEKFWGEYTGTNMDATEKGMATAFAGLRDDFKLTGMQPAMALLKAGNTAAATTLLHNKIIPQFETMRDPANKLIQYQLETAAKEQTLAKEHYAFVRTLCISGVLVGILLAVGVGAWLIRSIVRPLSQAVEVAQRVAAGDLSIHVDASTDDETGKLLKALRAMTDGLANLVKGVRGGTDVMTTASSEIAVGNQDLSARTEQQAASLEETAASMEELTSTVRQTAENAQRGNQLANAATQTAEQGGAVMTGVIQTMGQISQSAHKIADITSVIDGIAFQTNILALNAAVEAARAGEQGRGFAVVAAEVRSLAQRSAQAAKEIKALIDTSVGQVEDGARQVQQAGTTMDNILRSIGQVSDIMGEISSASREQSSGIELVNQAIVQMDQVTQQNAALVEEAAAAAASMQQQAQRLAQTVSVFKLDSMATSVKAAAQAKAATPAKTATIAVKTATPTSAKATREGSLKRLGERREPTVAAAEEWEAF